jgi:hypothetical protein
VQKEVAFDVFIEFARIYAIAVEKDREGKRELGV